MVDIHSHIIHMVDDGSTSIDDSLKMIREEIEQGVTDIILTPHFRNKMFTASKEEIQKNFDDLKKATQNEKINLYLGQEIYVRKIASLKKYIEDKKIITMNNTIYLLLEFSYHEDIDISEVAFVASLKGYKAIIAHIERYEYATIDTASEAKHSEALIQVNAESVVGKNGKKIKKRAWEYLENDLVDFIASDVHANRVNYMKKAYCLIKKKFGLERAEKLFNKNSQILLK